MAFEKTKEVISSHTEEEIKKEEVTQESDPETSSEGDTSENDEGEKISPEEPVEDWKVRALKAEQERENYKKGFLEIKAKMRTLSKEERQVVPSLKEEEEQIEETSSVNEEVVLTVLYRQNEKQVLRDVIDSKSDNYMPELVEDEQFNEIIGYLPRNVDKSSPEAIRKALRIAVAGWKYDRGITDKKPNIEKPEANLASSSTSQGGAESRVKKSVDQRWKILKPTQSMKDWY